VLSREERTPLRPICDRCNPHIASPDQWMLLRRVCPNRRRCTLMQLLRCLITKRGDGESRNLSEVAGNTNRVITVLLSWSRPSNHGYAISLQKMSIVRQVYVRYNAQQTWIESMCARQFTRPCWRTRRTGFIEALVVPATGVSSFS